VISGYAAVYYDAGDPGSEYRLWDDLVERIMPGAFDSAIRDNHDVRALFNHDPSMILGRLGTTLRISSDATGLRYAIDPPDTQVGRDVVQLLSRGDVSGSSFAFVPLKVSWEELHDTESRKVTYVRKIEDVQLLDVGPVTYPAYESTTAGVRAAEDAADARAARRDYLLRKQAVAVRLRCIDIDNAAFHA
jgi:HK97 family phage prohead protease